MRLPFKRPLLALVLFAIIKVIWVASCRVSGDDALAGDDRAELDARLEYLTSRMASDEFFEAHALTPGGIFESEWQLVALSMTAAAETNLTFADEARRPQATARIDALLAQALRPEARAFDTHTWGTDALDTLDDDAGHVGYLGYIAFMLGARRLLGGESDAIADHHRAIIAALARRMAASPSRHIETYPGQTYTADNSVAAAALAIDDVVTGTSTHRRLLDEWVAFSRDHFRDPATGIIVFGVSEEHGPAGTGRGSAAGYNSFYLPFVDEAFAREQYAALCEHLLVDLPFGARAFREHPDAIWTLGDVDSGPLVFGLSPSATGFGIAGARHQHDAALTGGLLLTAEGAGFTLGRSYLLAPLVGDAILVAMRTARPWDRRFLSPDDPLPTAADRDRRRR